MSTQAPGIEDMKEGSRASRAGLFPRAGGFTSVAWVVFFLVSWLSAGRASANSAPLPVSFEGSGQSLPQAEIRVAIATELGRETLAEGVANGGTKGDVSVEGQEQGGDAESLPSLAERERVVVAVDELGQLWVRYWGPRGLVDRHLPMPARPEQIPLVVSLSVGNLVRQEAFELLRDLERRRAAQAEATGARPAKAPEPAVKPAQSLLQRRRRPPRAKAPRENAWAAYLTGDFVYFPGTSRVCAPASDIHCYDSTGQPVVWDIEGSGIARGISSSHTRLAVSYARALAPELWGSVRAGLALSGGKAKKAAAANGGLESGFMPFSLELRLQAYPLGGPESGVVRPYLHFVTGISEESGEVSVTAPAPQDGSPPPQPHKATALRELGPLFAGVGFGASVRLFEQVRLEAELSGLLAFPSSGSFVRPGIGLSYDF